MLSNHCRRASPADKDPCPILSRRLRLFYPFLQYAFANGQPQMPVGIHPFCYLSQISVWRYQANLL
jgi:hypothetical protein